MNKTLFWIYFLYFVVVNCAQDFELTDASSCPDKNLINPCSCSSEKGESYVECTKIKSHTRLREIFQKVPNWKFKALSISYSSMMFIPASIFENSHFTDLNITSTTLMTLFDQPPMSDSLRNIYVMKSEFMRGVDWRLLSLLKLEGMSFRDTRIRKILKSFGDVVPKSLVNLWISNTNLTRLAHDAFVNLPNLELFNLQSGKLRKIEGLQFPKSIKYIDLSDNRIDSLSEKVFKDLPNLYFVLLAKNKLSSIPEEVFSDIPRVLLIGNPINCNCNIKWLLTTGKKTKVLGTTCALPDNLKGKFIKDLSLSDFNYCA